MKSINASLSAIALVGILNSPHASAQPSKLHPIILVESSGSLPSKASTDLLTAATRAGSDGLLSTIARSTYGADKEVFKSAHAYRGQVEMLTDMLRRMDLALQKNMQNIKTRTPGKRTVKYQMFWTETTVGRPPVSGEFSDMMLGLLTQYAPELQRRNLGPVIAIGGSALSSRIATAEPALLKTLKAETMDRFADIMSLAGPVPVWPLHFYLEQNLDGETGIELHFRFVLGAEPFKQGRVDLDTALLDKFIYFPYKQGRGVVELSFKRKYLLAASSYPPPTATLRFGSLQEDTVSPRACVGDECLKWIDALPTMYMRVNPAKNSWYTKTKAWLASFDEFRILFKSIVFNLGDLSLDPAGTELIFHVDAYTGGSKIIDVKNTKARSWFEHFAQRQGAIEGEILPSFDAAARKKLDDMMKFNLDSFIFDQKAPTSTTP